MKPRAELDRRACARLNAFLEERERIRDRKARGHAKPWTTDDILQRFRFCNVERENDKVTRWIKHEVRHPFKRHPHLWFMLVISRIINEPEVLRDLMKHEGESWPDESTWSARDFEDVLSTRAANDLRITGAAYMITTHGQQVPKPTFIAHRVLLPMWQYRKQIEPKLHGTLEEAHAELVKWKGLGDFLAGQVIADLKYTRYLETASDWRDWAVLGPGSRRGLQRVMGTTYALSSNTDVELLSAVREELAIARRLQLCLQDVQNCLCEFDKYERARRKEGKPKQTYPGLPLID